MLAVYVIDPASHRNYSSYLKISSQGYYLEESAEIPTKKNETLYLSPGWIDLHAHVYDGVTSLSVAPDKVGLETGVHLVVDAGSSGEATLPGFLRYVVPKAETRVRAWLNISSIGLVHLREVADLRLIDVDRCIQAALSNFPFVCGIKVRSSGAMVGELGIQPLKLAILAAKETGFPLMVHIGEAPPIIDDVLNLLGEGHIITHCFHGKVGSPWATSGQPSTALANARERGLKLDVGHGAASFSWTVARKAIANGYVPDTISTDVHIRNINGPVFDLSTTMTKLLHSGMSLEAVIEAVTNHPAQILNESGWCNLNGILQQATLFRVTTEPANSSRVFCDSKGIKEIPNLYIEPVAIISGGKFRWLESFDEVYKYSFVDKDCV